MLNPYFQQGARSEQNLIQDLINEQLRMYGVEVHYLPRKYLTEKTIIREVIQSKFDDAYPIEAYIDNFEGYNDNTTILSKFGIQQEQELNLIISKERFESYISPLMKNEENIKLSTRPKEGDLIYFPLGDRLFEIKFVEHEKPFYQLQKNYVYELRCELFRYEDEVIATGIDDIDDVLIGGESDGLTEDGISTIIGSTQRLTLIGAAATATASAGLVDGAIRFIRLTNRGGGYLAPPRVAISSAPAAGVTGIATAIMIGGINVCNQSANPGAQSVQQVQILNSGSGYTSPPGVRFVSNSGTGAAATVGISTTGGVGIVTISSGGSGYTTSPTVTISAPKHVGAAATAVLDSPVVGGGVSIVSAPISIGASAFLFPGGTTGGVFYKTAPTVTFALPTGTGNVAQATATIANSSQAGIIENVSLANAGSGYQANETVSLVPNNVSMGGTDAVIRIDSVNGSGGVTGFTTVSGGIDFEVSSNPSNDFYEARGGSGSNNFRVMVTSVTRALGGVINSLAITTGGRFYTSAPIVVIDHPGTSFASATIGIAGSSVNPGSIAFSTTGRAYTTAPTVAISTSSGQDAPTQVAVGIATIHPVSGIVTAVGFNSTTDPWCVGTGATIGLGYTAAPVISFSGNPSPVRATATVTITDAGVVNGITTTNIGFGYLTAPSISIANPGGADENFRALGIATIRSTSVKTEGTVGIGSSVITGITTTNIIVGDRVRLSVGHDKLYNFIPADVFVQSIGSNSLTMSESATNVGIATSVFEFGIENCGIVTGIAVTFGGGGYLTPPTVTISNEVSEKNYVEEVAGIATAIGIATVSAAGTISHLNILDAGYGYLIEPEVTISDAEGSGSGNFVFNETVTGSISSSTAIVRVWNSEDSVLQVASVTGEFIQGETITGSTSGATHELRIVNINPVDDGFADNINIENEADSIIDFSEQNPFGIP